MSSRARPAGAGTWLRSAPGTSQHAEIRKMLSQLLPHCFGLQETQYPERRKKDVAEVGCSEPGGIAGFNRQM